jgi:hypothetical protein
MADPWGQAFDLVFAEEKPKETKKIQNCKKNAKKYVTQILLAACCFANVPFCQPPVSSNNRARSYGDKRMRARLVGS